jgi:hypothetical protein
MNLYTSIPPKVSRLVNGQDVGQAWTQMCLDSWLQAGYKIYSVNSDKESSAVAALYPDINIIETSRDGSVKVGRPLVYVSDIISAAINASHKNFALINADIMFLKDAASILKDWVPENGFAYSTRLDIDDLIGSNPRLHGGVDFLILKTADVASLNLPNILFGTPWWDYWLPFSLNLRGIKGRRLSFNNQPVIAHLSHDERWSQIDFLDNFSLFVSEISTIVQQREDQCVSNYQVDSQTGLPGDMLKIALEFARASSGIIHLHNEQLDIK